MALDTYVNLKAAVASWLARTDLTASIVDFIRLAEIRVQQELNISKQETEATGTLTAGQDYFTAPAGFVEATSMWIDATTEYPVEIVSMSKLVELREYDQSGRPMGVCNFGTKMLLGPGPNANHPYKLFYRSGIPALETAGTNWLLTDAPNLLLYGACLEAAPFLKDDARLVTWTALFDRALRAVKKQQFRRKTGGGPLRVRVDFMP